VLPPQSWLSVCFWLGSLIAKPRWLRATTSASNCFCPSGLQLLVGLHGAGQVFHRVHPRPPPEEPSMATNPRENARVQVRCWLLDELLAAEDDLLALLARPEALAGGLEAAALSGAGAGHQRQGHGRRRAAHRCRELRPDLAAWEKNLLVVSSALHRNVHKWLGNRPCKPRISWTTCCATNSATSRRAQAPALGRKCASRS
jgi:hypothetical protein